MEQPSGLGEAGPAMHCDVLVVGGGINGAGIARDLAGRGWKVLLCERDDLAEHTSSASTKLIHGGLRYLEHREFSLVRKALQERERLMASAPHIMWPLRFVMPHEAHLRPAWMIRAGLFLYDHLAQRDWLPGSEEIDLRHHAAGADLQPRFTRGFAYSDGWVDDARLVVLNAVDARERGATVLTRTSCESAVRGEREWTACLRPQARGPNDEARAITVHARALVNACGPWAASFLNGAARTSAGVPVGGRRLRLVKGSHIVVPQRFSHAHAYLFQGADGRVIFAIPYERDFTLIGTTDVELSDDAGLAAPAIDAGEIDYLCAQMSCCFVRPVHAGDVVWAYSGVRPLLDDEHGKPSEVTRDYRLDVSGGLAQRGGPAHAALLNVWGGKLTTFRKLAEEAGDALGSCLGGPARGAWTAQAALPGGDFGSGSGASPPQRFAQFLEELTSGRPWLPAAMAHRIARAYGSRCERWLAGARTLDDLGAELAPGLHEAELEHLAANEWACTAADVLWRRSKIGLHGQAQHASAVERWLRRR